MPKPSARVLATLRSALPAGWELEYDDLDGFLVTDSALRRHSLDTPDEVHALIDRIEPKLPFADATPAPAAAVVEVEAVETEPVAAPTADATLLPVTVRPVTPARQMYDGDAGAWVESTPERRSTAAQLLQRAKVGLLVQAVAVAQLHDDRLYLDLGYTTWREFCEVELDMTDRHARSLRAVADQFRGLLPDTWQGEPRLLTTTGDEAERADTLAGLGLTKLHALTTVPDGSSFKDIVTTGLVRMPDGREVPLEEIRQMGTREMTKSFADQKKAMRERLHALEEEVAKTKAERDALAKAQETAQEQYATGKALERLYGAQAAKMEEKRSLLADARKAYGRFADLLQQAGIGPDDPESLRRDALALVDVAGESIAGIRQQMSSALWETID